MIELVQPCDLGTAAYADDGRLVPAGGTVGQILAKSSGADFATKWATPSGGSTAASAIAVVSSLSALGALDTAVVKVAELIAGGRSGKFVWTTGNFSTLAGADPLGGVYRAADGVAVSSGCWVRQRADLGVHVDWFGAAGDGASDDKPEIQAAINLALLWSTVVRFADKDYFLASALVAAGPLWRSICFEGIGTGNHQTADSYATHGRAGTVIQVDNTAAAYNALEINFTAFTNENFFVKGINFLNKGGALADSGVPIKVTRGDSNGRYVDGHCISDCNAAGFFAGIAWHGSSTTESGNNFFGRIILDRVCFRRCAYGWYQENAGCNLVSMYDTLFFDCPMGGIKCDHGSLGSVIAVNLTRCHMEGVGGMFRTDPVAMTVSAGTPPRNRISLHDFSHELCGATVSGSTATGDPFCFGTATDLYVTGYVDEGLAYGENKVGTIGTGNSITTSTRMYVYLDGGTNKSPAGMVLTPGT